MGCDFQGEVCGGLRLVGGERQVGAAPGDALMSEFGQGPYQGCGEAGWGVVTEVHEVGHGEGRVSGPVSWFKVHEVHRPVKGISC